MDGDESAFSEAELAADPAYMTANSGHSAATIVPVILSGGSGTRLWPFSTEEAPKQFLSFTGTENLFQLTLERVSDRRRYASPIIVGSVRHERELDAGKDQQAQLILEPCARNTAAAIVMAATAAREAYGDDVLLLVMPSDHMMQDVAEFHAAVSLGETAARSGHLVTFGVRPTGPDTGFGYLRSGDGLPNAPGVKKVVRFVEKPNLEAAEEMASDGQHLWNAGIFLFLAGTFLEEVMLHAPAIGLAAQLAVVEGERQGRRITADRDRLAQCPSESVDYAVMEHSSRVAVVPMSPGWSDLGSWDALASLFGTGAPVGPITAVDCESCYIRSDGLQVAALGVRDLIIVASGTRLLILPRSRSQEVKTFLSAMDSMAA